MFEQFNQVKMTEAAAVLLNTTEPRRMSYLRLLKLLYLANRTSIAETGFPIAGDTVYAMKNGPVLSRTLDCIKNNDPAAAAWSEIIARSGDWDLVLRQDPGVMHLGRSEVEWLRQVAEQYRELDDWELVEFVHELAEYKKNRPPRQGSRQHISPLDMLDAVGMGDEAEQILAEAQYYERFDQALDRAETVVAGTR